MKKFISLSVGLAACVWAADFWQTKPYTEWSDKDIQKIETSSPWSKQVPLSLGTGAGGPDTSRGKRGSNGASGDLDAAPGAGARNTGTPQEVGGGAIPSGGTTVSVTVSWRTALPVREAVAKEKFGAEAATSADAKKMIDDEQKYYGILVSGVPARGFRGNEKSRDFLLKNSSLSVKGKDPIVPADVQTGGNEQRAVVLFMFPKTTPLTVDDKEVEFTTRLGSIVVKQKFHLKDMVFSGKLEL